VFVRERISECVSETKRALEIQRYTHTPERERESERKRERFQDKMYNKFESKSRIIQF
jgi:hypothetical protein